MALENYRITEFQEKTQVDNGDYVLIDSATDGTHKYQLSRIPAQASAEVAAAVAAEKTAREAADAAEVTARNAAISAAISDEVTARNAAIAANVDGTLSVTGKAADAKKTGEEIASVKSDLTAEETAREEAVTALAESVNADYAKKDGEYADMTAGNADQLLSSVEAVDSVPYTFRASGVTADIGDREYDEIVGGTVAWNQLVQPRTSSKTEGDKSVTIADGVVTVVSSGQESPLSNTPIDWSNLVKGHKYLIRQTVNTTDTGIEVFYFGNSGISVNADNILNYTGESQLVALYVYVSARCPSGTYKLYPNVFDLTQMFGSTIADYIYSLETATAGAGVAFFRSLFPNDYYPYDAGSLKSVEGVSAHVTTGFNQWDEEWEVGTISTTTGQNASSSTQIRSKNYIRVFPNTNYYGSIGTSGLFVWFYDSDKNFITPNENATNRIFTTPSNACYARIATYSSSVTTTEYRHDICINLSWSGYRNGEYEPYVKHTYPLDDSLTLRGIPKLDSANHLYYDGDTYEADGTVTRRYGIVDLGTLTWAKGTDFFYASVAGKKTGYGNMVCDRYVTHDGGFSAMPDKSVAGNTLYTYVYAKDSAYTDAASFKTAMSGVYLVYELATPTTEEAAPYQSPQIVDDFGTEEYVTTSIVPVGHYTKYPENLRAKIEGLPWDFSTLIAPTEKTNKATRNYTSGSLLIMGNVLYKVTANIANGGTITPGMNVTATTLSEVILALA